MQGGFVRAIQQLVRDMFTFPAYLVMDLIGRLCPSCLRECQ